MDTLDDRHGTVAQAAGGAPLAAQGTEGWQALLEGIGAVIWEADPGTGGFVYVSPRAEQMLGYPVARWLSTPDFWASCIHPADRARTVAAREAAVAAARDHDLEYRMVAADGRLVWVHDAVRVAVDASGRMRLRGLMTDVTARKRTEEMTATVLEIVRDIGGSLDLELILERAQRRTAALLPCDRVATYGVDPDQGGAFVLISAHGVPEEQLPRAASLRFPADHPAAARIAAGEALTCTPEAPGPVPPALFADCRLGGVAVVPLAARGRLLGAYVAVNTAAHGPFGPDQVTLLEHVARHVAVALGSAELYRTQQEEAEVGAALARVGRELLSVLDTPALLDRLSQLATEVLEADACLTLLWDPAEHVFVPRAVCGYTPEEWTAAQVVRLPRAAVVNDLVGADDADVRQIVTADLASPVLQRYAEALQSTSKLVIALRRGPALVGLLIACMRGREGRFSRRAERIARGIGQIASLTLENARLVEELGRASRVKSDFLATMSHELRTPLNAIVGYTSLLIDGAYGAVPDEQLAVLRRLDRSATELLELINSTLDVARLEAGRLPMDIRDVSLTALLQEVEVETRPLRTKPGVEFIWDIPERLPRLRTDPLKLKVILKNLIGNATKFTEHGWVRLTVRSGRRGVEFAVSDTGIGIDPSVQGLIFEPFRQADSSDARRHGGVGLGLYVVRRLVESLGGSIALESAVGRGSTFRVTVPKQRR